MAEKYYTLAYRNNVKYVDKRLKASIAIDILRISRILFSSSINNKTLRNNSSLKNSSDTLFNHNLVEDLGYSSKTNSLLKLLLSKNLTLNEDMNNHENNNNIINSLSDAIDNDLDQLNWGSHSKNNAEKYTYTKNIDEDSYNSLATSSSSLNTLVIQGLEDQKEQKEKDYEDNNQSILDDTSPELEEIMECIQDFNPTTTQNKSKRNLLAELPIELKYHIIRTMNPDGILSNETVRKICYYVIHNNKTKDKQYFKTKTEFLNYVGIKEFKLDDTQISTEEHINSFIDQFHKN
jgi:hypothetical protein